jgi:OmpA-OmpF porin, OOP family
MRTRYLLGAGVALAMAFGAANAQAQLFPFFGGPSTIYFGVEGGYTNLTDSTGHVSGGPLSGTAVKQKWDDGYNVGARAGFESGPWRLEEEFRFQQNGVRSLALGGVPTGLGNAAFNPCGPGVSGCTVPVRGDRNTYAFMTNLIYDFAGLGWFGPAFTPHIGAGIGAVELRDGMSTTGVYTGPNPGSITNRTTWEFGYQAIGGFRYNINPALAFDLDYRYFATTDPSFNSNLNGIFQGAKLKSEHESHNLVASLSMRFGAPPPPVVVPPAPPAPPPVTRRVFLVFFDWDRDTITPDGMRIVQQAAEAFRAGAPVQIQVTGYTDASGSAGYNQRLSERRANNVANALARFGVPRQAMVVSGRGKNDQRVPTADGVREPQNRRVEIVFP